MNFHQSFKKCSILIPDIRRKKKSSNLLRINLKCILTFNEIWPLEGAMYITLWENFRGHPENVSFMHFKFSENGWFQTKRFTGLLGLAQLYKQNPLENFLIFTIYQNYTLALSNGANISTFDTGRTLLHHAWGTIETCQAVSFKTIATFVNINNDNNLNRIFFFFSIPGNDRNNMRTAF